MRLLSNMSVHVIYYKDGAKKMRPVLSREEYLQLRDSSAQKATLHQVRSGNTHAKMRLLQINYSCLPNDDGSLKGATRMSMTVGMDIDHIEPGQMGEVRDRILAKKDELGLLMLELSARGEGYHLVFRRRFLDGIAEGQVLANQERNLRWASELLGVEFDKGAKDITRVFFSTSAASKDLIYLSDELFDQSACLGGTTSEGGEQGTALQAAVERGGGNPAAPTVQPVTNPSGVMASSHEVETSCATHTSSHEETYLGIPYAQIIKKWWELYNDGQEPCPGNRNTLTFELAVNLRHICGFDRNLLDRVIPDYWEKPLPSFSPEASLSAARAPMGGDLPHDGNTQSSSLGGTRGGHEKLACIDSALAEKRTQMPKRLKDVIAELKRELLNTNDDDDATGKASIVAALDQADEQDLLYHFDRLPKMPQGVKDSIDAAGHPLAMPTLVAIAPAIGALATGVKLDVHGQAKGLNLCSFVVGDAASGKGQMDDIIAAWMAELQAETDIYTQQEDEWAAKRNSKKSGTVPQEPKLPVRMLTLVNTVPNIAERLARTDGKHSFSYTPEADNVAMRWKQSVNDFSSMLRQAYDESRYDREARSAEAVRVHIEHLRWNVVMCGTQDALYRVITNYTDGLLSRLAIARTPDNTFSPLAEKPAQMTDLQQEHIQQIAHLLPLMKGTVVLPKLEERGRQWLETIRLEAMKNDDRVLARQRFRGCVSAMRVTTALWLPKVAELLIKKHGMCGAEVRLKKEPELWIEMLSRQQTDEMLQLFDIVADYLIDNDLYYFRDRIEQAYESKNYQGNASAIRARKGKNDNIFERLGDEFTFEQAFQQSMAVKGASASRNSVHQMMKNWKNQGLVVVATDGRYRKLKN